MGITEAWENNTLAIVERLRGKEAELVISLDVVVG